MSAGINIPFYPHVNSNRSIWYCANLNISFSNIQSSTIININIKRSQIDHNNLDIVIPLPNPFISVASIDSSLLRMLCKDSDSNAIVTIHYLARYTYANRGPPVKKIVIVYLLSEKSEYGIKLGNDEINIFLINAPKNIVNTLGNVKKQDIILKIDSDIKQLQSSNLTQQGIRVRADIVNLEHIITIPQILYWPFSLNDGCNLSKVGYCISSQDSILVLLGSLVVEAGGSTPRYVFQFFPTPLLSYEYGQHNDNINPLILPSVNIFDSGSIILEIDLEELALRLFQAVLSALNRAYKVVTAVTNELKITLSFDFTTDGAILTVMPPVSTEYIDPKAILKALMNSFLVSGISMDVEDEEGHLRRQILNIVRDVHPHKVAFTGIRFNIRNTMFGQLGYYGYGDSILSVYRSYVSANRTLFLEHLFRNIYYYINPVVNDKANTTEKLLASYLLYIDQLLRVHLPKLKHLNNVAIVRSSLNLTALAEKITLLLLEFGLHGIAHMLLRHIAEELRIRKRRLNEIITLVIPPVVSREYAAPYHFYNALRSKRGILLSATNVVLDGYHYRLRSFVDKGLKGIIIISDIKPFTSAYWKKALQGFNIDSFVKTSLDHLRNKNCYRYWEERRVKAVYVATTISDKLKHALSPYISNVDFLDELMSIFDISKRKPQDALSVPLNEFRRMLNFFVDIIADKYGVPSSARSKAIDILKKDARPYLNAFYEYILPFCFDGCHNCILIDKGCSLKNPLLREWIVSRYVTEKILELAM